MMITHPHHAANRPGLNAGATNNGEVPVGVYNQRNATLMITEEMRERDID